VRMIVRIRKRREDQHYFNSPKKSISWCQLKELKRHHYLCGCVYKPDQDWHRQPIPTNRRREPIPPVPTDLSAYELHSCQSVLRNSPRGSVQTFVLWNSSGIAPWHRIDAPKDNRMRILDIWLRTMHRTIKGMMIANVALLA